MDLQPINQQPISDDQELAKVLAGVSQQAEEVAATQDTNEEVLIDTPAEPAATDAATPVETPAVPPMPTPTEPIMPTTPAVDGDNTELESIKKDALSELRPLVDKLNVSAEEKFDTYLLLLRSTDDKALIAPAHDAAKGIADEARRAQALLDIIKEIDYLAGPQQATIS